MYRHLQRNDGTPKPRDRFIGDMKRRPLLLNIELPMKLFVSLAVAMLLTTTVSAIDIPLDSHESWVKFSSHAFMHDFHGEATKFTGSAQVDFEGRQIGQLAILDVQTSQLTTFSRRRDQKMFRWLNVAENPEIKCEITRIDSMDGRALTATKDHPALFIAFGTLTWNKVSKPLQVQFSGWREGALLFVMGETVINTSNYGLPVLKNFWMPVDKDVNINFRLGFDVPANLRTKRSH
jgi:polyisoprenoid-binding protein YceI